MSTTNTTTIPTSSNDSNVPIGSNMAQSTSNAIVEMAVHRIKHAKDIERERRKLDPLFEYYYFDKNKALCMAYATQQGLAIGTCVHETKMYAAKLVLSGKHKHKDVQLVEQTMDSPCGTRIFHVAILVKTTSGVRYVTHSNGFHYDNSWDMKCQFQCPVTLNPCAVSVNGKLIRWRKKDWRVVKNKWKRMRAKNTSSK